MWRFYLIFASLLAGACQDYTLYAHDGDGNKLDLEVRFEPEATEAVADLHVDASFSVVHQQTSYGSDTTLCWIQAAFYEAGGDDGQGSGASGQVVEIPSEPGTCAYTAFAEDEAVADGSMGLRGTVDAGRALGLLGEERILRLDREVNEDGQAVYALENCADGAFPFGETFDVFAPGSARADGLDGFLLRDAVAVGPDLRRVEPGDEALVDGQLQHDNDEPLRFAWEYLDDPPRTAAGEVVSSPLLLLRNTRQSENRVFEALACRPEFDGWVEVPVETLGMLSPDDGSGETYVQAQVDVTWAGEAVTAPWGQVLRIQSLVTFGGVMKLVD